MSVMGRKETPPIGVARSEREILQWLIYAAKCPSCGKTGLLVHSVQRDGDRITHGSNCTRCYTAVSHSFRAAPDYEEQLPVSDPRLTTSETPSDILSNAIFRRWIDQSLTRLDQYSPEDRLFIEEAARVGLRGVDELRKLHQPLSVDDRRAAKRFADAFVGAGGELPAALAWCKV
jgi:hypothetical protein